MESVSIGEILGLSPRHRHIVAQFIDAVSDYVSIHDTNGKLKYVNEATRQLFKLPEDMSGHVNMFAYYDAYLENGDKITPATAPPLRAIAEGTAVEVVIRGIIKHSGQEVWMRAKSFPVFDEDGKPLLVINIFSDITTERTREKTLHDQSERAVKALEQALKS